MLLDEVVEHLVQLSFFLFSLTNLCLKFVAKVYIVIRTQVFILFNYLLQFLNFFVNCLGQLV